MQAEEHEHSIADVPIRDPRPELGSGYLIRVLPEFKYSGNYPKVTKYPFLFKSGNTRLFLIPDT